MRARTAGWLAATTHLKILAIQMPKILTAEHVITVNAGFSGSKSGQRKKPFKRSNPGPSSLDRILDRRVKFTTPPISQPITPTENAGCSSRPAS